MVSDMASRDGRVESVISKVLGNHDESDGREVSYIFFIEADGVVLFHEAAGRHDSSI